MKKKINTKENQVTNFEKKSWSKSHKEWDRNRGKNEKLSDIMIWMETRETWRQLSRADKVLNIWIEYHILEKKPHK